MEGKLLNSSLSENGGESNRFAAMKCKSIFYKTLPFYLSIGMPYELFWRGDCELAKCYREAYEIKKRQKNEELWLQGMYIYESICDISPILQAFPKKNAKPVPYSSEPYAITQKQIEERQKEKQKADFERIRAKMQSWVARTNKQFALRSGEGADDG